jgi:hypothetical protein
MARRQFVPLQCPRLAVYCRGTNCVLPTELVGRLRRLISVAHQSRLPSTEVKERVELYTTLHYAFMEMCLITHREYFATVNIYLHYITLLSYTGITLSIHCLEN